MSIRLPSGSVPRPLRPAVAGPGLVALLLVFAAATGCRTPDDPERSRREAIVTSCRRAHSCGQHEQSN